MERIEMFKTYDGRIHKTEKEALQHLDIIYTREMCKLTDRVIQLGKYQTVKHFLDENLDKFVELKRIKNDMTLINPEEEDNY